MCIYALNLPLCIKTFPDPEGALRADAADPEKPFFLLGLRREFPATIFGFLYYLVNFRVCSTKFYRSY